MNNQVVFQCKKCGDLLFVDEITKESLQRVMEFDCHGCGESPDENWVLLRMGNYEEECGCECEESSEC